MKQIVYVKGLGAIYKLNIRREKSSVQEFKDGGINAPISIRDASYAILRAERRRLREYTITCHAPICFKDSPTIIAREYPLFKDPKKVERLFDEHRDHLSLLIEEGAAVYNHWEKIAKKDSDKAPEKRRAIILDSRKDFLINKDSDLARFLWQDTREGYFMRGYKPEGKINCLQIPEEIIDSTNSTIISFIHFNFHKHYINYRLSFAERRYNNLECLAVFKEDLMRPQEKETPNKSVLEALKNKLPFEYQGVLYAPVRGKKVSLQTEK